MSPFGAGGGEGAAGGGGGGFADGGGEGAAGGGGAGFRGGGGGGGFGDGDGGRGFGGDGGGRGGDGVDPDGIKLMTCPAVSAEAYTWKPAMSPITEAVLDPSVTVQLPNVCACPDNRAPSTPLMYITVALLSTVTASRAHARRGRPSTEAP